MGLTPQPPNRGQLAALRRFEDERYIAARSDIESRLRFDLQSIFIEQVTIGSIITIILTVALTIVATLGTKLTGLETVLLCSTIGAVSILFAIVFLIRYGRRAFDDAWKRRASDLAAADERHARMLGML